MSNPNDEVLWRGKPWITIQAVLVSVIMVVIGALAIWLEFLAGYAYTPLLGMALLVWTIVVLAVAWLVLILRYILERATQTYILRKIGLEVEMGLLSKRNIVLSTSGFSDMQVNRSIVGRLFNVGDISIRSEGQNDIRLKKVRNPKKIADMIRDVMSRPLVRF